MAKRKIRIDGDPVLRKRAREIESEKINDKIRNLADDMFETMYSVEGVGLAANQIGLLKRIVVIDDREGHKLVIINPEISDESGSVEGIEGCLSVPNMQGKVNRYKYLKLKYIDEYGKEKELIAEDFFARVIQHEVDHLNGKLYIDRAEELYDVVKDEDKK